MSETTEPQKSPRAFSWFPGHMRKALRKLEETLGLADAVLLVMDARIPRSSRQPDLEDLLRRKGKEVLIILNKSDLAEEAQTKRWLAALRADGHLVSPMKAVAGGGAGPLERPLARLRDEVNAKRKERGLLPRDPRLVVVGIPNVGKSSLLNRLVGAARARTGAKPGVTRGPQWVGLAGKWQILDSPGILYPRIEGEEILTSLTAAGCVSLDAVPLERVGALFLARLVQLGRASELLGAEVPADDPERLLEVLSRRRSFLLPGDQPDLPRAARWLLQSFARGDLGPLTLEVAP